MKRNRALIVDTNEMVLFLYQSFIESKEVKFDRFFVDNIEKAKTLIELGKFNVLAINYKLKNNEESGIDIAIKFRKKNPSSPIIILSSLVGDAKTEAKRKGLSGEILFLRKPINFKGLSEKLENFLGVAPW